MKASKDLVGGWAGQAIPRPSSRRPGGWPGQILLLTACACLYAPASAQRKPDPLEQARKDQQARNDQADSEAGQPATTDAIIPDSQFQSALPPLDPAIGQPL